MKKFGIKGWLCVFLFSVFLFCFGPIKIYASIVAPNFPTLPIDDSLITHVGQAGAQAESF